MSRSLQVHFSNRIEELFLKLKEVLYVRPSTPFTRRLIIVPSPAIKSWLTMQLARDPTVGVAAGLEISYPDQTLQMLRQILGPSSQTSMPNALELALAIEWAVRQQMTHSVTDLWQPLFTYLQATPEKSLSRKSERRLVALSQKLATLFILYGKYAGRMVKDWEKELDNEWQQALWKHLFYKEGPWSYLYRELIPLQSLPHQSPDMTVHLLSLSFLPKVQHEFLQSIASLIPVHYYMLSPCQEFWSDIRSDRETHRLQNFWRHQGATSPQQKALEAYLKDCNPLLANFGRLGREMVEQIEKSEALTSEHYLLPSSIQEIPQYEALLDANTSFWHSQHPLTILEAIQADMLLLRDPSSEDKIVLSDDASIQVHAVPTRLREVEVLYDILVNLIAKRSSGEEPLTPGDILVMAPDITLYAPLIKMVFEAPQSCLDAQIMDLGVPTQSPLVQAFLHLLNIPSSRWDVATISELFHFSAFQKQQRWSPEQVKQLEIWIKSSDIRWGLNSKHRDEVLQQNHCTGGMLDQTPAGTWEFGLGRHLMGMAMQESMDPSLTLAPLDRIESTQGELLGSLIQLMRSLRDDLAPLSKGTLQSASQWSTFLKSLFRKYFRAEDDEEEKTLLKHLDAFSRASNLPSEASYSFTSIKKHLETALEKQTMTYRESHLQAVKFCTLLPMRTIPAKVVVLIGMHEGAFPKNDPSFSLNLMKGNPKADYAPSQTDFDRYLFLEALLSARQHFIMTYPNCSHEDYKEQSPSLLVSELLNYLDAAYHISDQKPSQICHHKHPFNAFHRFYFENNSPCPSYSHWNYHNACAYYQVNKQPPHRFLPSFATVRPSPTIQNRRLESKELTSFAKNPLKTYFNRSLGIYLENDQKNKVEVSEKFQLNHLELDHLKKKALKCDLNSLLDLTQRTGHLPLGVFKALDIDKVREDLADLKDNLKGEGLHPDDLFMIEFDERFTAPHQLDNGSWQVPPLQLTTSQGAMITLVGKINDASPQGLIVHQKAEKQGLVKEWPQYLIFLSLIDAHALPCKPKLIFAKSGKSLDTVVAHPQLLLKKYLDYYFNALENASPLIPEWVPLLLKNSSQELEEQIKMQLNNPFQKLYNDYLHWSLPNATMPDTASMLAHWKQVAEDLFGEAFAQWGKK